MEIIVHRVNTKQQLQDVPKEFGVELDIRYHNSELILSHDPLGHDKLPYPTKFEDFLSDWKNLGTMILNVKTEGIELQCIELMRKFNIKKWFFLDLSMPFFVLFANKAVNNEINGFSSENLAVRFSEYEPIEYALSFSNKAKWVWVDCFNIMPLDYNAYNKFKNAGFKICIVAPELQKHSYDRVAEFRKVLDNFEIDAVCTKRPDLWSK